MPQGCAAVKPPIGQVADQLEATREQVCAVELPAGASHAGSLEFDIWWPLAKPPNLAVGRRGVLCTTAFLTSLLQVFHDQSLHKRRDLKYLQVG